MALRINAGPYQRDKDSTLRIMLILTAALAIVWICAIVYSFKIGTPLATAVANYNKGAGKTNPISYINYGIRAILVVLVAVITSLACDAIWTVCTHKKDSKKSLVEELKYNLLHNYSYVSALIFALTMPVYTSFYIIVIGTVFATVVVKNFFGGFGKNIFNPAALGRIFVVLTFSSQLGLPRELTTPAIINATNVVTGLDAVSGSTLTTAFNNASGWLATTYDGATGIVFGSIFAGHSLIDLALGNYLGAMGETFTLVILVLGVVLSVLKVINWRTPAFYLGTVALSALVVALVCGFTNPLNYVLYHLCLGGLMFGAVFMLTDPVTAPTSPVGKAFIGIFAGLMTMVIRIKGGYPEGVVFAIALCNLISPAIDHIVKGKTNQRLVRKGIVTGASVLATVALIAVLGFSANGGKEVYVVNGMDRVQYSVLTDTVALNEGEYYVPREGYTVKTSEVNNYAVFSGYSFHDTETKDFSGLGIAAYTKAGFNTPVFDIMDANGNKVATAYTVKATITIPTAEGYSSQVTSYGLVAIKADAAKTIYGIGTFTEANTKGYANIIKTSNELYAGQVESKVQELDYAFQNGSSYSSNLIKLFVAQAYAEHNR